MGIWHQNSNAKCLQSREWLHRRWNSYILWLYATLMISKKINRHPEDKLCNKESKLPIKNVSPMTFAVVTLPLKFVYELWVLFFLQGCWVTLNLNNSKTTRDSVVYWLRSWTHNPRVVGSIPSTGPFVCNPGQVALLLLAYTRGEHVIRGGCILGQPVHVDRHDGGRYNQAVM